jgi:hypothetical protein
MERISEPFDQQIVRAVGQVQYRTWGQRHSGRREARHREIRRRQHPAREARQEGE